MRISVKENFDSLDKPARLIIRLLFGFVKCSSANVFVSGRQEYTDQCSWDDVGTLFQNVRSHLNIIGGCYKDVKWRHSILSLTIL